MTRCSPRTPLRTLLVASLLALAATPALAQTGTIRGTVAGPAGKAVSGAQVSVAGTRLSTVTTPTGAFTLSNVPTGTQRVRVAHPGYVTARQEVTVGTAEPALVAIALEESAVALDGLVVSASRQAQRVSEAPATITKIGTDVLEASIGNSFVGALKGAKGVDYIQVGATGVAINARGFNSSFNNRMLMMEDGRVAVLPENGMPVGQFTAIPKVDLEGLEVIVGPGAALYGADASNGVLTLTTKDPREYPGTTVEVTGGNREYKDVQFRHAGVAGGNWGYKVAGEFQDANDWSNTLFYGAARLKETGVGGEVDWDSRVMRGTASLVRYFGDSRLEFSGGMSETDGVGQTNVGRNQLVDWRYSFQQARLTTPGFFVNLYRTESDAGNSYALNRFTEFRAGKANAGKSDEEIRQMSDWPSNGQLFAAEAQNNFRVPQLLNTRVVWGGQYRHDVVSSERQWLTDRLSGSDLAIDQYGFYAQTETPLLPQLTLLLAGRYDDHENYDAQFSPKVGVVVQPAEGHNVRLTYNRAFKSPTTLQTNFFIPDFIPGIGVFGNTDGFEVKNAQGASIATYKPLVPEENQTWELGYKGVVGGRLFVDVTGYRSRYEDFLSPLTVINFPALGSLTYRNGQVVANEAGTNQAVLTYFNLGTAKLRGVDAGVNYVLSPRVSFAGTMSWTDLESIDQINILNVFQKPDTARIREASSLNAPEMKWSLGTRVNDGGQVSGGFTMRHVREYFFASGINKGTIPTFTTLDANLGVRVPRFQNLLVNLGVTNLFACRGANAAVEGDEDKCGFGSSAKHIEMINMPEMGTMVFLGMKYQM